MKKKLLISCIVILISIFLSSVFKVRPDNAFMNTMYTISGIMFSIGMGVICTFNPDKIKNMEIFKEIKYYKS